MFISMEVLFESFFRRHSLIFDIIILERKADLSFYLQYRFLQSASDIHPIEAKIHPPSEKL